MLVYLYIFLKLDVLNLFEEFWEKIVGNSFWSLIIVECGGDIKDDFMVLFFC